MDKKELEKQERLKAADELEAIAVKIASSKFSNKRLVAIVATKLEEAALWYAKLLRSEEE